MSLHQTNLPLQLRWLECVIGIQECNIFTRSFQNPKAPCATNAQVNPARMLQQTDPTVPTRKFLDDLHGIVPRAIIDDQYLKVSQGLIQDGFDALEDVLLGVI
jgi:hypothetical protein